jgi:hypothetical protein
MTTINAGDSDERLDPRIEPGAGIREPEGAASALVSLGIPGSAPRCTDSAFELGSTSPDVTLIEAPLVLHHQSDTIQLDSGRVFFSVSPRVSIRFAGRTSTPPRNALDWAMTGWAPETIEVSGTTLSGRVWGETVALNATFLGNGDKMAPEGELRYLTMDRADSLSSVTFHILNFRDYVGDWIDCDGHRYRGRLVFEAEGWRVTLDQRSSFKELQESLRAVGGYAFTHIGLLQRIDGAVFTSDEAEDVLAGLHWFLSFMRGTWVCPILFSGIDSIDSIVWQRWDAGRVSPWAGPPSWCDTVYWDAAKEAFITFMAQWRDPFERSVLKTGIGQYVSANKPSPVELAIMVAQSGLELLGWVEFVETGKIAKEAWKHSLTAANKMERLLQLGRIDTKIPNRLGSLVGLDSNWHSGPDVVAGVRNILVHPRKKDGALGWQGDVLTDAWMLATHYLERTLLRRLGVSKRIRSRLNPSPYVGAVEDPPWTRSP